MTWATSGKDKLIVVFFVFFLLVLPSAAWIQDTLELGISPIVLHRFSLPFLSTFSVEETRRRYCWCTLAIFRGVHGAFGLYRAVQWGAMRCCAVPHCTVGVQTAPHRTALSRFKKKNPGPPGAVGVQNELVRFVLLCRQNRDEKRRKVMIFPFRGTQGKAKAACVQAASVGERKWMSRSALT